jgi:peptidyl-prolyl cis-trans isomerase SurA
VRLPETIKTFLLFLAAGTSIMSCSLLKDHSPNTIITIDGNPVSTDEFLYVYNKNNLNKDQVDSAEIRNYLDLFINFKLKVREAEELGLDQDSVFIKELEGYRKQLADPYLTETRLSDSLCRITYERLKTEVNASHILIQVDEGASPRDTFAAYEKIMLLSDEIKHGGQDFGQVAFERSEDPSAKQNRGNLGYFTAMQMVYPFEEAAYSLPVDSVSGPVKTQFGYHLIKVHDKRPSQGRIQVSHILVRSQQGISPADSVLSAKRALEIYRKAANHEDWDLLCRQFSEDVGTKMNGGRLPWFKTGDISNIPAFEEAAFRLNNVGEISEPVKTDYGWHIIRLEGRQGLESYEELEPRIKASVSANSRAELNQQELVKRLKNENKFRENKPVVEQALGFAKESLGQGTWSADEQWDVLNKVLFSIGDSTYLVTRFYDFVENKQPFEYREDPVDIMREAYGEFSKHALIDYEEAHLAQKYYDYRMLLKEYRDGILLFQLMESKVWNQALQDTTGLKTFFSENQQQYQWNSRAVANIYNASNESALEKIRDFIEKGYFDYHKYDFYSDAESLNKTQLKILEDISQILIQGQDRYLIIQYDKQNQKHQEIYNLILKQLATYNIDINRISETQQDGSMGLILFAASSSINDLLENMNENDPLTVQIESGQFQPGENMLVDQVPRETGMYQLQVDNRFVLVEIKEILPADNQKLDEIKGQVISDYQTQLDMQWVNELRSKYQVDIHEKELEKVYENYHN